MDSETFNCDEGVDIDQGSDGSATLTFHNADGVRRISLPKVGIEKLALSLLGTIESGSVVPIRSADQLLGRLMEARGYNFGRRPDGGFLLTIHLQAPGESQVASVSISISPKEAKEIAAFLSRNGNC